MANTIRLKRRVSGSAGAPSGLKNGEVAINEVDQVMWYGLGADGNGDAVTITAIAGSGAFVNLSGSQTVSGDKTLSGTVNVSGTLQLGGTSISASAAEINKLSGVTAGTASAGKVLVVDSNKDLDLDGGDLTVQDMVVEGNLTVQGTTTTLNSVDLVIKDKLIELAAVETPTDTTANGGGIRVKGATDKEFKWSSTSSAFTSSEHMDLASGKKYHINGSEVLSSSALGSGVTGSSLTSVGTLTSGSLGSGFTTVAIAQGGTGQTTAQAALNALSQVSGASAGQVLTKVGSDVVWANTADTGISSLNGLTDDSQTFAVGTDATNEAPYWASASGVHTLHLPNATNAVRGLVSNAGQVFGGRKCLLDGATVGEGSGIGGVFDVYNTGSTPAVLVKKGSGATGAAFKFIDNANAAVFEINASGEIVTGAWAGTTIPVNKGGTGATTAADARDNLGLEIGADVQAYSAKLASIAGLTGTFSSGIVKVVGFSDSSTAEFIDTTAFSRGLLDDASASDARSSLGLVINTDVQAYSATLAALSGLTSAADKLPYFTGSGTASVADLSSFGRSLIDDSSASDARTTLGLGSMATQASNNVSISGGTIDNVVFDGGSY